MNSELSAALLLYTLPLLAPPPSFSKSLLCCSSHGLYIMSGRQWEGGTKWSIVDVKWVIPTFYRWGNYTGKYSAMQMCLCLWGEKIKNNKCVIRQLALLVVGRVIPFSSREGNYIDNNSAVQLCSWYRCEINLNVV